MNVRLSVLLASPFVAGVMLIASAQEAEIGSPSDIASATAKYAPTQGPQQAPSKTPAQAPAPEKQAPAPAKAAVETEVGSQYVVTYAPSCPTCQIRTAAPATATYRAPTATYSAPRTTTATRRGLFRRYR